MGKHSLQRPPRSPRRPRSQALLVAVSVTVLALVATVFVMYGGTSSSRDVVFTAKDIAPESSAASSPAGAYVVGADATSTTRPALQPVVTAGRPIRRATVSVSPSSSDLAALRHGAQKVAAREAAQPETSSFRVGTLNVLGSNHTDGHGGFGSGPSRAAGEADLIHERLIDVIGLSEVQPDQYAALARDLPDYTVWPQGGLGRNGYRLQIAWRTSRFEPVDYGTTTYLFSGQHIPMPYALLRDRQTGASFWVISTHNSPQEMQNERIISTQTEVDVIRQLQSQGHPVFLLGDLNEDAAVYCRIGAGTGMISANGGSYDGGCHPPSPSYIDWIMSTRDVDFSGYVRDTVTRSRGLSDHPIYYADAQITDSKPATSSSQ